MAERLRARTVALISEDDYYRILESKSVWIQNRVGPILKALTFQGDPGARKLLDAIEHFKKKKAPSTKRLPSLFWIPQKWRRSIRTANSASRCTRRCCSCTFRVRSNQAA